MNQQKPAPLITLELANGEIVRARRKIDPHQPQQTMNQLLETEEADFLADAADFEEQAGQAVELMNATALQAQLMGKIAALLAEHLDDDIYELHPDFIDDDKLVEQKKPHLHLGVSHDRLDQLKTATAQAGFDVRSRPDLGFLIDFNTADPNAKKIYIIAIKA